MGEKMIEGYLSTCAIAFLGPDEHLPIRLS